MRAMVAVEHPDGSVEVIVLAAPTEVWIRRDSADVWAYSRPYAAGLPWRTTIEVTGYGESTHYRERPEWFPAPQAALPPAAPAIEAP